MIVKSPITGKEMKLIQEEATFKYKGIDVTIDYQFYLCEDTNECFTTTELDEINLQRVYDQYDLIIKK